MMISIDEFVHSKAKESGYNISELCEHAIRNKVCGSIDAPDEEKSCFGCGRTKVSLTWLCPDEKWFCNKCMRPKVRKVIIGVASKKG